MAAGYFFRGAQISDRWRPWLDARRHGRDALLVRACLSDDRVRHNQVNGRPSEFPYANRFPIGGLFFGILADRIGRTRALMASILVYSLASAACGLSHSIPQLATFRFLLGLGMGGEWSSGAALIAETWRAEHRGRALGLMQSAYAIGEAVAAAV